MLHPFVRTTRNNYCLSRKCSIEHRFACRHALPRRIAYDAQCIAYRAPCASAQRVILSRSSHTTRGWAPVSQQGSEHCLHLRCLRVHFTSEQQPSRTRRPWNTSGGHVRSATNERRRCRTFGSDFRQDGNPEVSQQVCHSRVVDHYRLAQVLGVRLKVVVKYG